MCISNIHQRCETLLNYAKDKGSTMLYLDVVAGKKEQAIAELESEIVKGITSKWKSQTQKLDELFKRRH